MKTSGKRKYIVATIKSWNIEEAHKFIALNPGLKIELIDDRNKLTFDRAKQFRPRYIFFPHWSWIIPREIYDNFECIVFHMTDLPFGRGGSPLQNLIERGIYQTKITAIRAVEQLDAGPIYLKRDLRLEGSAEDIFKRASKIIFEDMTPYIIGNEPSPVPQKGKIVTFNRRTPKQSNIANLRSKRRVYDYIRMLDAEGYPSAFVETPELKIEFFNAKLEDEYVSAQAKIEVKHEK